MKKSKIFIILFLILMIAGLFSAVKFAYASADFEVAGVPVASYYDKQISRVNAYPGDYNAQGQKFTVGDTGGYLTAVVAYMQKIDGLTGTYYCYVGGVTAGGVSDNSVYATATLDATTLSTSLANVTFTFDQTFLLESGHSYCYKIVLLDSNCGGTYYDYTGYDGSNVYAGGDKFFWYGTSYSLSTGYDYIFAIKVNAAPYSEPTPTPTPIPTVNYAGYFSIGGTNIYPVATEYGSQVHLYQTHEYTYIGHVMNNTSPWGTITGTWYMYITDNYTAPSSNDAAAIGQATSDYAAGTVTQVLTGTLTGTNGFFTTYYTPKYYYASRHTYTAYIFNGTVNGADITFEEGIINATDPNYPVTDGLPPTAEPTATNFNPVSDPNTSYGVIGGYIIALILILIPAITFYAIGLRSVGFMILGLAIGSGLGYLLMPAIVPIWLLFVMVVGLVGNFFKDTIMYSDGGTGESE